MTVKDLQATLRQGDLTIPIWFGYEKMSLARFRYKDQLFAEVFCVYKKKNLLFHMALEQIALELTVSNYISLPDEIYTD